MDRRRSAGYLSKIHEGTEPHNSVDSGDVPAHHDPLAMPTREECRSHAAQGHLADLGDKVHHPRHHRTIHEREQLEDRIQKKSVTQKDIEALHEQIMDKDERNVLGETDPIDIDVTGMFPSKMLRRKEMNMCVIK